MTHKYQQLLNEYYLHNHIHPQKFKCQNQEICRSHAFHGNMTETKMSMVGSQYGVKYPKIVVVSLDPPSGDDREGAPKNWSFKTPGQRTMEFISSIHEKDNYSVDRPNPHWAMTQIIVKDLLAVWGYKAQPNAAIVQESYSGCLLYTSRCV